MEVDRRDVVERDLPHDAHAERGKPAAVRLEVGGLEDHHVAAVATALVEQAAGGGALLHGRDHLEKRPPDRHDGVLEAEGRNPRIPERDLDIEDSAKIGDHRLEVACHERYLTDMHVLTR